MSRDDFQKKRLNQEVEKTLDSLSDLDTIDVGPFFFTRLQSRLTGADSKPEPGLLGVPFAGRLAAGLVALVVILNIATAVVAIRKDRDYCATTYDNNIGIVADQYLLTGTSTGPKFPWE